MMMGMMLYMRRNPPETISGSVWIQNKFLEQSCMSNKFACGMKQNVHKHVITFQFQGAII